MRNIIQILSIGGLVVIMTSCNPHEKKPNKIIDQFSNNVGFEKNCESPKIHRLPSDSAILFINDLCSLKKGDLYQSKYGIGAYIPASAFDRPNVRPLNGYYIYPCLDNSLKSVSYFVIGPRDTLCNARNYNEFQIMPTKEYTKSTIRLDYNSHTHTPDQVVAFLNRPISGIQNSTPVQANQATIALHNQNFRKYFSDTTLVDFGCGFIQKEYIDTLMNIHDTIPENNHPGVAVVLGRDTRLRKEQIRMIFFAVDNQGQILHSPNDFIVEKSWPPRVP